MNRRRRRNVAMILAVVGTVFAEISAWAGQSLLIGAIAPFGFLAAMGLWYEQSVSAQSWQEISEDWRKASIRWRAKAYGENK